VKLQPEVRALPGDKIRRVKDLLARKRQLNEMRTQELNRSHRAQKITATSHRRLLKLLDKEIAGINNRLAKEVTGINEWKRTYDIVSSVPGLGDGVAFTVLG